MLFPQRDTFTYNVETKDVYGTITAGTATSHKAYNEQKLEYTENGSVIARGKLFTTDTTSFIIDATIIIDSSTFTIVSVQQFTIPGYIYQEIRYV